MKKVFKSSKDFLNFCGENAWFVGQLVGDSMSVAFKKKTLLSILAF